MELDNFLNDNYLILKLLYDNQVIVFGEEVIPITQNDVCEKLGFSKNKIYKIFQNFQQDGILICHSKGKYSLTNKAKYIIEEIEKIKEYYKEDI